MLNNTDEVIAICNAYEQGFGQGHDRRHLKNPYVWDSDEYDAWNYGHDEGERKRIERTKQEAGAGFRPSGINKATEQ